MRRVALVGNMNNIHFSFLRYLRDLNVDAYLFLYKNEQPHFLPENDTWRIEKWKDFIIQTDITNGLERKDLSIFFYSKNKISKIFKGFDIIICNGSFPIYAHRAKIAIDFFLPYSVGMEFLSINMQSPIKFLSSWIMRVLQSRAINKSVNRIVTLDFTNENLLNFKLLKKSPTFLGLPMVYPELVDEVPSWINKILEEQKKYDLIVFSHVSHIWKNIPGNWAVSIKKNQLLIEGFDLFCKKNPSLANRSKLYLLEYGPDVGETKKLISNYGIDRHVEWIPAMKRKELMILVNNADIGAGEFGGLIWGGTGWEFMSQGVPFFQYVDCDDIAFKEITGHEFPEIFNTDSPSTMAYHFANYFDNPELYKSKGRSLKKWFSETAGQNLVEKYIRLMQNKDF